MLVALKGIMLFFKNRSTRSWTWSVLLMVVASSGTRWQSAGWLLSGRCRLFALSRFGKKMTGQLDPIPQMYGWYGPAQGGRCAGQLW